MHCLTVKMLNNHKDEVVAIKDFKTAMVTMMGRLTNGQLSSSGSVQQSLQENSGILTDIPTENKIVGIYRGISEEIPR